MSRWIADNVPNIEGKIAFTTGVNVGLGYASTTECCIMDREANRDTCMQMVFFNGIDCQNIKAQTKQREYQQVTCN